MQFVTVLHKREEASKLCDRLSEKLNQFQRGSNGLTPESVRLSSEYDTVKNAYSQAFRELRAWNGLLTGKFKAQYKEWRVENEARRLI